MSKTSCKRPDCDGASCSGCNYRLARRILQRAGKRIRSYDHRMEPDNHELGGEGG